MVAGYRITILPEEEGLAKMVQEKALACGFVRDISFPVSSGFDIPDNLWINPLATEVYLIVLYEDFACRIFSTSEFIAQRQMPGGKSFKNISASTFVSMRTSVGMITEDLKKV